MHDDPARDGFRELDSPPVAAFHRPGGDVARRVEVVGGTFWTVPGVGTRLARRADDAGDIAASINALLARLGIVAIVGNLAVRAASTAGRRVVCQGTLVVTIYETPAINRARAGHACCAELAEYIAGCLNLAPIGGGGGPLPVFDSYALAWETPASASATVTFNVQSTINPPEE